MEYKLRFYLTNYLQLPAAPVFLKILIFLRDQAGNNVDQQSI